jgi:hypothetical protein
MYMHFTALQQSSSKAPRQVLSITLNSPPLCLDGSDSRNPLSRMYAIEVTPSLTKNKQETTTGGGARLELGEGVGVVGETEGVKVIAAGVHLVKALAARAAVHSVALDRAHQQHLAGHNGDDGLRVHQGGVAQVVQAAGGEDLRAGLPPDGLAEGDAVLGQQLWGDAAQRAQHGPPCVDHLDLAVPARATADAPVLVSIGQC